MLMRLNNNLPCEFHHNTAYTKWMKENIFPQHISMETVLHWIARVPSMYFIHIHIKYNIACTSKHTDTDTQTIFFKIPYVIWTVVCAWASYSSPWYTSTFFCQYSCRCWLNSSWDTMGTFFSSSLYNKVNWWLCMKGKINANDDGGELKTIKYFRRECYWN